MTQTTGRVATDDAGTEATRQQALLAAFRSGEATAGLAFALRDVLNESGARAERGLAVYRANGTALAERALAAAFPMVKAMVGAEDFAHMARALWREHPPQQGDMGEWGGALPDWIEAQPDLAEWPWLADCARLELARHRCERAADAVLDEASLGLLAEADPAQITLVLAPGTWALNSRWPLATIHAAHGDVRDSGGDATQTSTASHFDAVRSALAEGRGEAVLVARQGWRAVVHQVDAATVAWTLDLLAGMPLAQALERAGEAFDFAAWLQQALTHSWLKGVAPCAD
jgi:Putative DNA-binding domain